MFTELRNMIGKIKYALYGVKLNAKNFLLWQKYPHRYICTTYNLFIDDTDGEKCNSRSTKFMTSMNWAAVDLCLTWFWVKCHQRVKAWNFEHSIELHIMHFLFCLSCFLILWTLNKSYRTTCSRILPLSVFCVLQGGGVTPLKCGEI